MSQHTITRNGEVVAIVHQECCPTDTHVTYLTPKKGSAMKWMCPKCGISLERKDAKQQHLCGNKAIELAWETFCKKENVQPDDEPLFYEYFRKG